MLPSTASRRVPAGPTGCSWHANPAPSAGPSYPSTAGPTQRRPPRNSSRAVRIWPRWFLLPPHPHAHATDPSVPSSSTTCEACRLHPLDWQQNPAGYKGMVCVACQTGPCTTASFCLIPPQLPLVERAVPSAKDFMVQPTFFLFFFFDSAFPLPQILGPRCPSMRGQFDKLAVFVMNLEG